MADKVAAGEWIHIDDLVPWDPNPRDNEDAAWAVAKSIEDTGFGAPIVVQRSTMRICAGHSRRKAVLILQRFAWDPDEADWVDRDEDAPWQLNDAPEHGMVPCRVMDLTDEQATRLALADNKTAEIATWDDEGLKKVLAELDGQPIPAGWSDAEIQSILAGPLPEEPKTKKAKGTKVKHTGPGEGSTTIRVTVDNEDATEALEAIRAALAERDIDCALDQDEE